jgi:hypothetical protein
MTVCKKIAVLSCMAALVLPVWIAVCLQVQTVIVRHEMLEALEKEQLVTLRLAPSEINWYKQDKELQVGDELFDVKAITLTEGTWVVTGLFDKKEKALKKQVEDLARKNETEGSGLSRWLQQLYHAPVILHLTIPETATIQSKYTYDMQLADSFRPVEGPPPQCSPVTV